MEQVGRGESESLPRESRGFGDLTAWQCAMDLTQRVYAITRAFPAEERFGLTSQARRAAVSVPSNIAEGYGRESSLDFLRHLRIARGSLCELRTQLELAVRLGFIPDREQPGELLDRTARLLHGLIRSIEARQAPR